MGSESAVSQKDVEILGGDRREEHSEAGRSERFVFLEVPLGVKNFEKLLEKLGPLTGPFL